MHDGDGFGDANIDGSAVGEGGGTNPNENRHNARGSAGAEAQGQRLYKPSTYLGKQYRKIKEKAKAARKRYACSSSWGSLKTAFCGMGSMLAFSFAIPLMVINRESGVASIVFGYKMYLQSFGKRKICGYRKPNSRKLTGKKLLYLNPFYLVGLSKSISDADKEDYLEFERKNVLHQQEKLEQARILEAKIIEILSRTSRDASGNGRLGDSVNQINMSQLKEAIHKVVDGIDEESIEAVVKKFTEVDEETGKEYLRPDVYKMLNEIQKQLNGKDVLPEHITVNNAFQINLINEFRRMHRMEEQVVVVEKNENGEDVVTAKSKINIMDVQESLRDVLLEAMNNTKIANEIGVDTVTDSEFESIVVELMQSREFIVAMESQKTEDISKEMTEVIKKMLKDKNKGKDTKAKMEKKVRSALQEAVRRKNAMENEKVRKMFNRLSPDQLVGLIHNSLYLKDSIAIDYDSTGYGELMEEVKELDVVNREYEDLTGERIYEDIEELVFAIRESVLDGRNGG